MHRVAGAMGAVPEAGGAVQPIPPTVNGNIPIYRAFRAKILIYYLLFLTLYCLIIRPFKDNILIYVYYAVKRISEEYNVTRYNV